MCLAPALIEANFPAGVGCSSSATVGAGARPGLFSFGITVGPKHSTEPFRFNQQVFHSLALTEANFPDGGAAAARCQLPQHSAEPSSLTPQVCSDPELTEANLPSGGLACLFSLLPQHSAEPSRFTPQV